MKKAKARKTWMEKAWSWFKEKCRDGQCQVGIPQRKTKVIKRRDRN